MSEARIFKTLSITEAERKKADAYKTKGVHCLFRSLSLRQMDLGELVR